ncbi:MAG: valine--tRNA ligase [Candidatus Eisenbacteria bacterium]|uniref:Valine--tRNA ligase n=1 Tax=Eiseniibacteriota bacterium TaxID=2212470 RepID=A0A948W7E7_UNCEI|nr:valine--tRNA ligase [Candidatus Eisenbacteria bacterium]MBU1948224.1 valine--tRNA ligase [Candidatus Eisenbacteria bacterium]MBU2692155.1 valine--tRNA ligase [Candidatus Eisenbacteria bacterium]
MKDIPKVYDPQAFEEKWYKLWEEQGAFRPAGNDNAKPYVIMMPPPNVTGALTVGHVLNNTIQDVLIRWKRMEGAPTLWLPGTDHAGIATQSVVKRHLDKQGIDIKKIGREEFLKEAWKWKEAHGGRITQQLRRLGASCDWSRERFTLDDGLSKAVEEIFRRLYNKKLVYRGQYLINWCSGCRTAVSDEEVEYQEEAGKLYYVRYPFKGTNRSVTVATTRPETILGDTAIAVHPQDDRYKDLIGATLLLPILGREIPLIADTIVDREFGTGALKVTPGCDPVDYQIGERHNLEKLSPIGTDGLMTELAGPFAGQSREECRRGIVKRLKNDGLLEKVEPLPHSVGNCYRCGTVIEPLLSEQWFVKMKPLAEMALDAYTSGSLRFVPERWGKVYMHWLENIRDWCISRQLWWGHRIPIWYCENGHSILSGGENQPCADCGSHKWRQDEDVLDTWFSSWLWPFSTLGWPERTEDLERFFPSSVLVTGPDIIFFWVARMVMASAEVEGRCPFKDVYLTGLVRDEEGRKMSKSLGNSPDPIDLIDRLGADALRFTMLMLTPQGNDILFGEKKVEVGRNFANKVWNATRLVLQNLDPACTELPETPSRHLTDRWLRSSLSRCIAESREALEAYRFNDLSRTIYEFVWHEYCDWYLEILKIRLRDKIEPEAAIATAIQGISTSLQVLHPLMPFVTEELWSYLPGDRDLLIVSPWPEVNRSDIDEAAIQEMAGLRDVVVAIRTLRSEMNVPPARVANVTIRVDSDWMKTLREQEPILKGLARIDELHLDANAIKPSHSASAVVRGMEVFVHLEGVIDLEIERKRLQKELDRVAKALESSVKKLANQDFLGKARPDVVEAARERLESLRETRSKLDRALSALED